jgi:hypothetical protein
MLLDITYLLGLSVLLLREELVGERALQLNSQLSTNHIWQLEFLPGMLVEDGRHGRMPPFVEDA